MASDPLIDQLGQDRTVEYVRNSTSRILAQFNEKLGVLRGNDEITKKILRMGFDGKVCFDEAIKFFGTDKVRYLAVDGTEFQDERLDMLIFFAGAYAYGGQLEFSEDGKIEAHPPSSENDFFGLSCAIPLSEEYSSKVSGELTEHGVETDPSRVPQALMHFAEYYVAYTALKRSTDVRVLIMDRTVSGDIAHISWKMRELIKDGKISLQGIPTSKGMVSGLDLELGRMLVANEELKLPAARSQFLKFAAIQALMQDGEMNVEQIIKRLGANEQRKTKLFEELKKDFKDAFKSIPEEESKPFALKESTKQYWNRLIEALEFVASKIFSPKKDTHPLQLEIEGKELWITSDDLSYFTLITIYAILKEAWKRNILVLGIVKDTAASELTKAVIKVLENAKLLSFNTNLPPFNSDKMLLQTNSVVNTSTAHTPWRTFEYDVCFRTVSPKPDDKLKKGESRVEGAFKNVITSERMFVKAYFQLWSSENDPSVRSHVFLYDRPCYPRYDSEPELVLLHHDTVEEKIQPAMHYLQSSPVSDLAIGILCSMGMEPIPEAIGHNYPLFLADKKAKWIEDEASKTCVAAVDLEVARSKLDQQILYETRFRDYRSRLESNRKSKRVKK